MKIKDLTTGQSLDGVRFIYPGDGKKYYWASQWSKGVWGRESMDSTRIFPLKVDDLTKALDWEVAND